jgi:diguanylate cyclase (GGDEF)-like protein/PAS domain S-box-containing protein
MTTSETHPLRPFVIEGPLGELALRPSRPEIPFNPDPALYQGILDEIDDGVYMVDRSERIQSWNKGAEAITGFSRDDVLGRTCADNLLCHVDSSGRFLCTNGCPLRHVFVTGIPIETDAYLHHKDGHRVPVHIKTKPLRDQQDRVVGAVEVFRRTSEAEHQTRQIEELSQLALIDELTRLPNHRLFDIQLERRLAELDRFGWPFGVLVIDLDRFGQVNDDFGHQLGDDILGLVARTLSSNCRSMDTVVRLGGDKFAAIIANVRGADLHKVAEKLRALVAMSGLRGSPGERHRTTVSIGGALANPKEALAELVERAEDMLRAAKRAGRNRVCL